MHPSREGRKWVMVQLTPQGERCKSWNTLVSELRSVLGVDSLEVYFPGIWWGDEFWERAQLLEGYIFVEYDSRCTYGALQDPSQQRVHYFKTVVCNKDASEPETIDDERLEETKRDVRKKLIPPLEPGSLVKIRRGQWRNYKAFIEQVTRNGLVCCTVRTPVRKQAMILERECFARDPEKAEE